MNVIVEKDTDALLDQALHEIHLTVWSRFINENNLLLDYTDLSGNISLPTPDECEQNQPNALGWWSPIENAGFFNGDYLLGLLTAYHLALHEGKEKETENGNSPACTGTSAHSGCLHGGRLHLPRSRRRWVQSLSRVVGRSDFSLASGS